MRDTILDTTAKLVSQGGPQWVAMSQVSEQTGIGPLTFSDVEGGLLAWHEAR
ncbi:hypothetical protein ACIPJS_37375 [Streptomyces sp. NPDC086783]|uniref:hypothetical protein n=1 Tax=Streptomyces sp. NPDC086783 TaxID=3365758 RepID=UPI00380EEBE4